MDNTFEIDVIWTTCLLFAHSLTTYRTVPTYTLVQCELRKCVTGLFIPIGGLEDVRQSSFGYTGTIKTELRQTRQQTHHTTTTHIIFRVECRLSTAYHTSIVIAFYCWHNHFGSTTTILSITCYLISIAKSMKDEPNYADTPNLHLQQGRQHFYRCKPGFGGVHGDK